MSITVETDRQAGFCGGVIRAITKAEEYLASGQGLYSLGAIVHNEAELQRLTSKGLETIEKDSYGDFLLAPGSTILIRAHGEPPSTYEKARVLRTNVIDCTCPVVLRLQASIREAYERLHTDGRNGQIVIFGKIGHAEVLGLVGQVGGDAVVIEDRKMLEEAIASGAIDLRRPIEIFSQTTKSPAEYAEICSTIEFRMSRENELQPDRFRGTGLFRVHDTICSQVANRHARLTEFAAGHDIIIFVAGKSSSNGKVLFDLCKTVNIRTYHIGSASELRREWFRPDDRVGVSGATSTPKWLLEEVAEAVKALND
ncbi:MAG: 4-hydroxy-3-methylbut-2-enyl diphosphate reductase [Bacteroidales bacterium]|nr:4-hydroxy-3-methylbut-2-enyl diphosphate reductase [Bacteroidales bacterium]